MNWLAKQQREATRAKLIKALRGHVMSSKEIVEASGMAKALVNRVLVDLQSMTPPMVTKAGEYEHQPGRFSPLYALAEEAPAERVLRLMPIEKREKQIRHFQAAQAREIGERRIRLVSATEVEFTPVFDPFTAWIPRRDMQEAA